MSVRKAYPPTLHRHGALRKRGATMKSKEGGDVLRWSYGAAARSKPYSAAALMKGSRSTVAPKPHNCT